EFFEFRIVVLVEPPVEEIHDPVTEDLTQARPARRRVAVGELDRRVLREPGAVAPLRVAGFLGGDLDDLRDQDRVPPGPRQEPADVSRGFVATALAGPVPRE